MANRRMSGKVLLEAPLLPGRAIEMCLANPHCVGLNLAHPAAAAAGMATQLLAPPLRLSGRRARGVAPIVLRGLFGAEWHRGPFARAGAIAGCNRYPIALVPQHKTGTMLMRDVRDKLLMAHGSACRAARVRNQTLSTVAVRNNPDALAEYILPASLVETVQLTGNTPGLHRAVSWLRDMLDGRRVYMLRDPLEWIVSNFVYHRAGAEAWCKRRPKCDAARARAATLLLTALWQGLVPRVRGCPAAVYGLWGGPDCPPAGDGVAAARQTAPAAGHPLVGGAISCGAPAASGAAPGAPAADGRRSWTTCAWLAEPRSRTSRSTRAAAVRRCRST